MKILKTLIFHNYLIINLKTEIKVFSIKGYTVESRRRERHAYVEY